MLAALAVGAAADPMTPEEAEAVLATLSGTLPAEVKIPGRDRWVRIGRTEEHAKIRVVSSCSMLATPDDGGPTAATFAVHDGRVHPFASFAFQRGDAVWMCHAAGVAELRADGTCVRWSWFLAGEELRWSEDDATCARDGATVTLGIVPAVDPATSQYRDTIRFEDRGGEWFAAPLVTELPTLPEAPSDLQGGPLPKTKRSRR